PLSSHSPCALHALPSFPTRRSSDLTARFALSRSRLEVPRSLVQPDLLVEDLELGLVDVVLHPRLGDLKEGRAGDHVPVEPVGRRSEEHTSELQSRVDLVCRLLLEKK